jgi:transposase
MACIPVEAVIVARGEVPAYLRIAARAKHLRELGMSDKTIGRMLGVSDKTIAKAVASWREHQQQ